MPAPRSTPNSNNRLYCLAGILFFWFILICGRLVWLQVVQYGFLSQKAARQQQRSIEVSPVRGNIYDRNGNDLAMTVSVDSVFAVPSEVPDVPAAARILGHVLKSDPREIEARLDSSKAFTWIARKLDSQTSARIRALNLKGIYFQKESKRFYPKGELAAQVLGYVGMDDEGLGGIEREYDSSLQGKPGKMLITMDARRRWFGRVEKDPDPGQNVILTIDEKIQYIVERELDRAMAESHAVAGTIIVQNPHTGEILALANRPTFNPNFFNKTDPNALKDRAVSDIYEPGSTFKVVTLAAALNEKITNPDEVIDCEMGSIVVNGLRIHDHKPYGNLTLSQVLQNSSDVGAIKIALRLGDDRFERYIRAFGFGSQSGIELPGETWGIVRPVSRWSKVSIGAISMGQEVGVSPVQLISMISTIANDGMYVPPRIIAATTAPRATPQLIAFHPAEGHRVISPMTAAQMKHMMEGVVLHGTGPKAMLNGYTTAGKTGTSQKVDPATGRYSHQKHVASFAGFAPINNPAVTMLVVLDTPVGPQDGGAVAAPVYSRAMQQVLAYLNVPHDIEVEDPRIRLLRARASNKDFVEGAPDRIEGEAETAAMSQSESDAPAMPASSRPAAQAVSAAYRPSGAPAVVTPPAPPPSRPSISSAPVENSGGTVVMDVAGGIEVPDFRGKTLRAAMEEAQSSGLELEVSGSGVAQAQSPDPGSHLPHGGRVTVHFSTSRSQ